MNLIEQANALKGLSDEQLTTEMRQPSGATAPFLVASELGRRKDMRQRYEAEAARRAPSTTVTDDLLRGMPPAGAGGGMGLDMAGPGGAPRPMQAPPSAGLPAAMPAPQGFADGGLVDAVDYNAIAQRYEDELANASGDKQRAQAMALLAAGAGMMSGGHTSTLSNIGEGLSAGLSSYTDSLKTMSADELNALRGMTDIGQLQHAEELAQLQAQRADREFDQSERFHKDAVESDKTPAAVRTALWYNDPTTTDEQRADYDKLNPSYNPNALNNDQLIGAKMDAIYQDAQKKFPINQWDQPGDAAQKLKQAQLETYSRIKATYGPEYAAQWASGMGIPVGDLVVTDAPGAPALDQKDPLGLGL